MTPLFEERVMSTLARATEIFKTRGQQYGDSWRDCQFLAIKSAAKELGLNIKENHCRAIAAAALYDIKYQRLQGGYREDSIDDGINYGAFLAAEMRAIKESENSPAEPWKDIP